MASGGDEHRMVFDIRGKRRNVVKVVYAILAVLMGLSLFLVTGIGNIGSLFGSGSESANGAKVYEEQAERIERKLTKSPEDTQLLTSLIRSRLNAGNQQVEQTSEGATAITPETLNEYQQASEAWSEYLKASDEPGAGTAQLMVQPLVTLAEAAGTSRPPQFEANVAAAAEAQEIVAEQRPSLNSWSTLAIYTNFTFDYKAAEEAEEKAIALTQSKAQKETLENQMGEYRKRAKEIQKGLKSLEEANKQARESGGKEAGKAPSGGSLENPLGGLGGTIGE
jgi:DNA repair exonuclease SbcCD ATPase subunit